MERYNRFINIFPDRVLLRTHYNLRPLRPHTISRDGVVRTENFADSLPVPHGRYEKLNNRIRFAERSPHGWSVRLNTDMLMVNSFYHFEPGFASHLVYLDGNENNINIENLLPLFGTAEEHEYYSELLSRENDCRVLPMVNIDIDEDANLDNFLITDTGRAFSIKSKMWMTPTMGYGYRQLKLRIPRRSDPEQTVEKVYMIHRLVCRAFNGPPIDDRRIVDHIDNNHLNNNSTNLRWVTEAENLRFRRNQPARPTDEPLPPPQPLLGVNPQWRNAGMYLNGKDFSQYEVCTQGIVRDIRRPSVMKTQSISGMGYRMVTLRDAISRTQWRIPVHTLVAYTFHRDTYSPDTPVVDHINENKFDNRAENLRWVTSLVNIATATGVRVRRTDLHTGDIVDYLSISACVRENPGLPNLKHHLSERMEPELYGDFEFQRISPLRRRARRQRYAPY